MWLQGSGTKIVGEASAVIEIKSTAGPKGGLIYLTSGGPTSNFYNSEGQLITSGANIDIPRGTYNWDANAGGTGVAGWKAEASG
jgi:hypothetical protein